MRGYGQFCPVALGAEVFAERWTPLILRELLAGSHRFSELQRGLPGIPAPCSPSGWGPCSGPG
jgi:DNA-binding HxlR family transcriptional regulator